MHLTCIADGTNGDNGDADRRVGVQAYCANVNSGPSQGRVGLIAIRTTPIRGVAEISLNKKKGKLLNIVPAKVEQQINRVDRTPSLVIGIVCAVIAAWCLIVLLQLISMLISVMNTPTLFGSVLGSLFPQLLLYGAVGFVAVIAATGFIARYAKRP